MLDKNPTLDIGLNYRIIPVIKVWIREKIINIP